MQEARIRDPARLIPDAMQPIFGLVKAAKSGGVPETTMELVHLRVSQINGCSLCVDAGGKSAKRAGDTDGRILSVAAWEEAPYYIDAERAALALAEAATRLADRHDPVSDAIWDEAAKYYDEKALASLTLWIGVSNLFNRLNRLNRLNRITRQPAGAAMG